ILIQHVDIVHIFSFTKLNLVIFRLRIVVLDDRLLPTSSLWSGCRRWMLVDLWLRRDIARCRCMLVLLLLRLKLGLILDRTATDWHGDTYGRGRTNVGLLFLLFLGFRTARWRGQVDMFFGGRACW